MQVNLGQIEMQRPFLRLHVEARQKGGVGQVQIAFGQVVLGFEIGPLKAFIVHGQAGEVRRSSASAECGREGHECATDER